MKNSYRFVSPNHTTIKEIKSQEDILPNMGDYATVYGQDYIVFRVTTEYNFDNLTKSHVIYLDNIQGEV